MVSGVRMSMISLTNSGGRSGYHCGSNDSVLQFHGLLLSSGHKQEILWRLDSPFRTFDRVCMVLVSWRKLVGIPHCVLHYHGGCSGWHSLGSIQEEY